MPRFHEVVLTAPDIDADVFRRDLAPVIVAAADRVTLYASSNDEALIASRAVHGYRRAGDSGENVVVVPGVDTVDVSNVDTSLIGHCYYGNNRTVLADLFELIHSSTPPDQRRWLRSMEAGVPSTGNSCVESGSRAGDPDRRQAAIAAGVDRVGVQRFEVLTRRRTRRPW